MITRIVERFKYKLYVVMYMEGEKKEVTPSKKEILGYTLKKIDYQLSRNVVADKELYDIYKYFFANYYNITYEFSADELTKELDKLYIEQNVRMYYDFIISKVSIIEFKDDSLKEKEIRVKQAKDQWLVDRLKLAHFIGLLQKGV